MKNVPTFDRMKEEKEQQKDSQMKATNKQASRITAKTKVQLRPNHYVDPALLAGMVSYVRVGDEIVGLTGLGCVVFFHVKE